MALSKWRGSASLIVAARKQIVQSNINQNFDYEVLMIGRPDSGTFAGSTVFPGGVHEVADESVQWLNLFQKFGVPNEKLTELIGEEKSRPEVFKKTGENSLHCEISLRIAALREAFEEVGLLITREKNSFKSPVSKTECGTVHADFDCAHWQKEVHKDASTFLNLFNELELLPDLWSLHEWSTWMTPSTFQKRFQTVFYVVGLNEIPTVLVDAKEVSESSFQTPQEFLTEFQNNNIFLLPPQIYELARLCNFTTLNELLKFAYDRASKHGMLLLLPIQYRCTDGIVALMPGDDMYPNDPLSVEGVVHIDKSIEDCRAYAKHLHRFEWSKAVGILNNILLADGQISPKLNLRYNKL